MSAPLAVPASPASSKRSRSRDSSRSAAASSLTPAAGTPFLTPSASTPSLVIPNTSQTPSIMETYPSDSDPMPYPAFLKLSRIEIQNKFNDLEWEQRKRLVGGVLNSEGAASKFARVSQETARNRNRYMNVDPYENNRVRLKVPDGHNDYINASPIVLKATKSEKITKFIATQGPKSDITAHIWRMVWHETQSPAVIVMLTQTHETGREKCYPYYPQNLTVPTLTLNEEDEFEDGFTSTVTLKSISNDDKIRAQIRELEMKHANDSESETRLIWHFLFGGWPDFSVPDGENRQALLNLIDMSRSRNADNAENPRIVHCSAGVGRSGTFIALDWLLQELEEGSLDEVEDEYDPIVDIVERLRQQRMMMVQGEAQFNFLYDVLRDRWRDRWAQQHPEDASLHEHKSKKQKPSEDSEGSEIASDVEGEGDEDERAELEAERVQSEMDLEKEKTASSSS